MIGTLEIDSDSNWIAPLAVSNGSLRSLRCPLLRPPSSANPAR
jgi:hypothetical protein